MNPPVSTIKSLRSLSYPINAATRAMVYTTAFANVRSGHDLILTLLLDGRYTRLIWYPAVSRVADFPRVLYARLSVHSWAWPMLPLSRITHSRGWLVLVYLPFSLLRATIIDVGYWLNPFTWVGTVRVSFCVLTLGRFRYFCQFTSCRLKTSVVILFQRLRGRATCHWHSFPIRSHPVHNIAFRLSFWHYTAEPTSGIKYTNQYVSRCNSERCGKLVHPVMQPSVAHKLVPPRIQ